MKRIFTVIIVLITLSVLGIVVIQAQWVRNTLLVRQEQEREAVNRALLHARVSINDAYLDKTGVKEFVVGDEALTEYLAEKFSVGGFTADELRGYLDRALAEEGVQRRYEFAVTDVLGFSILASPGFKKEMFETAYSADLKPLGSRLQETLAVYFHEGSGATFRSMLGMILASVLLTGIVIAAFSLTLRTLLTQKKLSEIKSDFINNMTHEFKTPLATISLAVDALQNEKVMQRPDQIRYYGGMIKEENKRMNKQVETILQAARLERDEIKLALAPLDAHALINKVAQTLVLQIEQKEGRLDLDLKATNPVVSADEVHFSNIVFNLLDNAIKYSPERPQICISTANPSAGLLAIRVTDNGIGMTKETAARVFEKFYRAHTGNVHNVKGFGLGLSYVKAIVDAHGGRVRVESTPGKGSTFTVTMKTG